MARVVSHLGGERALRNTRLRNLQNIPRESLYLFGNSNSHLQKYKSSVTIAMVKIISPGSVH